MSIDGIINEQNTNFVGKDGFYWWIGEVEDNEDPLNIGRCRVRVLNYYTSPKGGTPDALPTEDLPWATVLQGTDQAGSDGTGNSSGQLQPGAIVMGFFLDGESAQMPVVMGVIRGHKGERSAKKTFAFTGEKMPEGISPNPSIQGVGSADSTRKARAVDNNSVPMVPKDGLPPTAGGTKSIGTQPGVNGSTANPNKPRQPPADTPIPLANGSGGPWKTLEYELKYLIQDLVDTASSLVKDEKGDFIDVFENKVYTAQELVAKLKNFLSAVFAQVVAAIRAQLDELVQKIEKADFIATFLGIPGTTFAMIQTAISAILSLICGIDQQIISFINDPIGFILNIVNQLIEGAIDVATAFVEGVQGIIDKLFCSVENILKQVMTVVDTVKGIVKGVGQATEIIEAWQDGSGLFNKDFDIKNLTAADISAILNFLLSIFDFSCNRKTQDGADAVGFFPFFGVTSCTPAALAALPFGGLGPNKNCGGGGGGNFIDSFMEEADPYLTSAKSFINGAYQLQMGTPGRQATITRSASGTTHTSVKANNAELARHKARVAYRATLKRQNPALTPSEVEKRVEAYVLKQTKNSPEGTKTQANMTADHISYAGNKTCEVRGDDCMVIDGDYGRTVKGDYRLKVTGNCFLEVGGQFVLTAEGAPKQADKKGKDKKDKDKIQNHEIRFSSDVDMNIIGANFKMQSVAMDLSSRDMTLTASSFKNLSKTQNMSGGEIVINAGNAFTVKCTTLTEWINAPDPKGAVAGRYSTVGGPITFTQLPALAGGTPPFTVTTPGPFLVNCAAGGATFTVAAGAFTANVAAGAIALSAAAGAVSLTAGAAMTLTAGPSIIATAAVIKLN